MGFLRSASGPRRLSAVQPERRGSIDVYLSAEHFREALERDVRVGLGRPDGKWLPPVWFYDARGSQLFEEITRLPEYYLTRAERRLLSEFAGDIAERSGADTLIELGAGSCEKSRILLDALSDAKTLETYIPLDVSEPTLVDAATSLRRDYPDISVLPIVADFIEHLDRIPRSGRRLIIFLGSTIGNLAPDKRGRFLFDVDCTMAHEDSFLLGVDLVKDRSRLVAAYDDAAGVTAEFNRNVLLVLNRELDANFDPEQFEHVAVWNEEQSHIEMRLRSLLDQSVKIAKLDLDIHFARNEELLTETSAKFTAEAVEKELGAAGLCVEKVWQDPEGFLLALASPYC